MVTPLIKLCYSSFKVPGWIARGKQSNSSPIWPNSVQAYRGRILSLLQVLGRMIYVTKQLGFWGLALVSFRNSQIQDTLLPSDSGLLFLVLPSFPLSTTAKTSIWFLVHPGFLQLAVLGRMWPVCVRVQSGFWLNLLLGPKITIDQNPFCVS